MRPRYDAVVIGSGFGGAITAHRLAEGGYTVALLEQGQRWRKQDFPRSIGRVAQAFWTAEQPRGLLELRTFRKIDVVQGVGVGGGSLHYFNVNVRAPARVFERGAGWPAPIRRPLLDRYYDLVLDKLESRRFSAPAGYPRPPRTEAFLDAARVAGRPAVELDISVYAGADRKNRAGVEQQACTYCGSCLLGCHVQAKNSLDITYIAEAEARHGLTVFPGHKVECLTPLADGSYRVDVRVLSTDGASAHAESVLARHVVVAAGALGSTELLLRCRDVHRTLPRLGPALGRRFSGNGDFLFAGAMGTRAVVDPAFGPPITAAADVSTDDDVITIEDLGYPDVLLWLLEGALPRRRGLVDRLKLALGYAWQALGGASRSSQVSRELANVLGGGRTAHFLPFLGMGTDAGDGVMRLRDGALDVDWDHRASRAMFRAMEAGMRELAEAAHGRYVTSLVWRWPLRKLFTAHPLGGCVMGTSDEDSVVDERCRVWNYPGLYVTDGAAIPGALAVNPSLTIGAVAERAAQWMLHEAERSADDVAAAEPAALRVLP